VVKLDLQPSFLAISTLSNPTFHQIIQRSYLHVVKLNRKLNGCFYTKKSYYYIFFIGGKTCQVAVDSD
jgi:hypothetical protein